MSRTNRRFRRPPKLQSNDAFEATAKRAATRGDSTSVYVRFFPPDTTEEELRAAFDVAGRVGSITIYKNMRDNMLVGFGYVDMLTTEGVQNAIDRLNGKEFRGWQLKVVKARPKKS